MNIYKTVIFIKSIKLPKTNINIAKLHCVGVTYIYILKILHYTEY